MAISGGAPPCGPPPATYELVAGRLAHHIVGRDGPLDTDGVAFLRERDLVAWLDSGRLAERLGDDDLALAADPVSHTVQ
jgi:hypothetical protein